MNVKAPGNCKMPTHIAAEIGNQELMESLLEQGANYIASDAFNQTPLTLAIINDRLPIVRTILSHGNQKNHLHSYTNSISISADCATCVEAF